MIRLFGFLTAVFIVAAVVNVSIAGGNAFVVTTLRSAVTSTQTTIPVNSITGFLTQDIVWIEDEAIWYDNIDTVNRTFGSVGDPVTRGYRDTRAAAHVINTNVYNSDTSALNNLVGFNLSESTSVAGTLAVPFVLLRAMSHAFPKLILWDFAHLSSAGGFYFKLYILWPISAMGVIGIVGLFASVLFGLFNR